MVSSRHCVGYFEDQSQVLDHAVFLTYIALMTDDRVVFTACFFVFQCGKVGSVQPTSFRLFMVEVVLKVI